MWSDVMGLWHFDGVYGGTTFTDSKNGQIAEAVGACFLTDTLKVFGPTALRHQAGGYLRFPRSSLTAGFGYSDAWTIEGRCFIDVAPTGDVDVGLVEISTSTAYQAGLYLGRFSGQWYAYCYAQGSATAYASSPLPITHGAFFAFRLVSTGSSFALLVNGSPITLTPFQFSSRVASSYGLLIGTSRASLASDGILAKDGLIDELRITKASRGTSAYTLDTVAFPNS